MDETRILYIYNKKDDNYNILEIEDFYNNNEIIEMLKDAGFKNCIIYNNLSNCGLFDKIAEI